MEPVTLVRWLVLDGSRVAVDEAICEIESAVASVTVPAWAAGVIRHIAREGDRVRSQTSLAEIVRDPQ